MQILELYIRDGIKYKGAATSTSTNNLVDANADFSTVKVGYIVFNDTDSTTAKVTAVTNSTTLALSADIFASGELYTIKSDFERLDLFEDESVTITDTIKNTKDISKVFTPFSQQFNVPASKHNSKLFRHYEDFDVINSFDARFKIDALIKLNGSDYKKGRVRLNSVSMKDNKAHSYKLVFFGDTIELKDILGDDDLSRLNFPSSLNFAYDYSTIKSKFISVTSTDVCFPLITHSKNMRFSNSGYKSTNNEFLNHLDIKPAIKVRAIIEAIQNTYDLEFTGNFFNLSDFRNLYLWMHREQGFMSNSTEGGGVQVLESRFHLPSDGDFTLDSGTEIRPAVLVRASSNLFNGRRVRLVFDIDTSGSDEYNLTILRSSDNSVIFEQDFTGPTNPIVNIGGTFSSFEGILDIKILFTTASTFTFTDIEITAKYQTVNLIGSLGTTISTGVYTPTSLATSNQVIISRQMPKMKVIDFLTNLFKMFNLVAFKEDNKINVLPLNDFYAQGTTYDITKYVDTTKSTVEKVLQYKSVKFDFKSKKSFLIQNQQELLGNNFAGESYPPSNDNEWDGKDFKVELDFEKMLYERLSNSNTGALSTICQGAMLDKDFNATIGQPLLLYIEGQATSDSFKLQDGTAGALQDITAYNRPSQVFVPASGTVGDNSAALNFGLEIDEFFREVSGTNLFAKYYLDYIISIYNRQGRIIKLEAYLPLHIILNYSLADKFIIHNKAYRINSIKTNLLNNKSTLELYNVSEASTTENVTDTLPRIAALNIAGTSSSSVTLGWTPLGDVVANNITGYDVIKDDEFVETLGNDISGRTITGLDSGVTFKFGIRTRYTIGGTVFFSKDRISFATTD
tara:strand:+ start:148 stop:2703 length:2556 start_codon:yes stop_codon:yes gene_type:complete